MNEIRMENPSGNAENAGNPVHSKNSGDAGNAGYGFPERPVLYAITDAACMGETHFLAKITQALAGGASCLQLREKHLKTLPPQEAIQHIRSVVQLCHAYHVPCIVNDEAELALLAGADGVHVGRTDQPVQEIRTLAEQIYKRKQFIIGATAKTVQQATEAQAAGADYLGVGAVFPSPTKPEAIRVTAETIKQIRAAVRIPVIAIGGITTENISALAACQVDGVAVVSALFAAEDIQATAANLIHSMKGWHTQS